MNTINPRFNFDRFDQSNNNSMNLFLFAASGVNVRAPNGVNNTGSGGICPAGHECPQGTAMPIPCVAGYYAKDDQMEACEICPPGR